MAQALLTALTFILPLDGGRPQEGKKDDPALNPLDSDKLPASDYTGKLLTMPGSDGTFTLQIDIDALRAEESRRSCHAKEAKLQAEIQTAQQKMLTTQAHVGRAPPRPEETPISESACNKTTTLLHCMAQSQIKPRDLKEVTDTKMYDMKLTDNADIRYMNLPMVFDDDGKVKKYSDAEIKDLKGKKTTLPGYEGKLEDLKVGQTVKVSLIYVPLPKPKTRPPQKNRSQTGRRQERRRQEGRSEKG